MSASRTAERIAEQLPMSLNDWQDDALREAVAAAMQRGVDIDRAMRSLAASGNRFDLRGVLDTLRPPAGSATETPYHLPTCSCGGDGWVDGPPEHYAGRDYPTIARCPEGGPITPAMWDSWQASAGQWTRPAPASAADRAAAARRMTAAARAALPAPEYHS